MSNNPPSKADLARQWHPRLSEGCRVLGEVYSELQVFGLAADDIPMIVRLVENPEFDLPGIDLFPGGTSLWAHDQIHILLGRGLLAKDEAFVLGFTMGSTNRMGVAEETLYSLCARYLFPRQYRFGAEEVMVFKDAVKLGHLSDCTPLNLVDFEALQGSTVDAARQRCGIEADLLEAYYRIEKRRYPHSVESQRLV